MRRALWLVLPPLLPTAYVVMLVVGGAVSFRRVQARTWAPSGARAVVGVAVRGAALALVAALLLHANRDRRPAAGEIVDLAFPLRNGTYLVVNGGSVELLNAHLAALEREKARPYRGQSHGVDLVMIPMCAEVAWLLPEGRFPYWRGHPVDVVYDPTTSPPTPRSR